jgi:ankyrin repeat protein
MQYCVKICQSITRNIFLPLLDAIQSENLADIKCMILMGADCNIQGRDCQTPMLYTVSRGLFYVVRTMVEKGGASVDISDDCGTTVI